MTIALLSTDTVNMIPNQYQFYIERTDAGNITYLTVGLFTLNLPVAS